MLDESEAEGVRDVRGWTGEKAGGGVKESEV